MSELQETLEQLSAAVPQVPKQMQELRQAARQAAAALHPLPEMLEAEWKQAEEVAEKVGESLAALRDQHHARGNAIDDAMQGVARAVESLQGMDAAVEDVAESVERASQELAEAGQQAEAAAARNESALDQAHTGLERLWARAESGQQELRAAATAAGKRLFNLQTRAEAAAASVSGDLQRLQAAIEEEEQVFGQAVSEVLEKAVPAIHGELAAALREMQDGLAGHAADVLAEFDSRIQRVLCQAVDEAALNAVEELESLHQRTGLEAGELAAARERLAPRLEALAQALPALARAVEQVKKGADLVGLDF